MSSTQVYESVDTEVDSDDSDVDEDVNTDEDDVDEESSPPKKQSPANKKPHAKKKAPKKRRAPPGSGGFCRSFICAFLVSLLVLVGLIAGGVYILARKGYHLSATHEDGNDLADDNPWFHGGKRPKSLDSSGSTLDDAKGDTVVITRARGHNTEHEHDPTAEVPPEGVPVSHSSGHISISSTSSSPGVNVLAVDKGTPRVPVETASPAIIPEPEQIPAWILEKQTEGPQALPTEEKKPQSNSADDDALSNPNTKAPP